MIMIEIINEVNKLCGTNGCTTYKEIAKSLNIEYTKIIYWVNKYYKQGLLGIIYPGLGGFKQNYIYNKCCTIK